MSTVLHTNTDMRASKLNAYHINSLTHSQCIKKKNKQKKSFLERFTSARAIPSGLARFLKAKLSELEMDERARPLSPLRGKQTKGEEKTHFVFVF